MGPRIVAADTAAWSGQHSRTDAKEAGDETMQTDPDRADVDRANLEIDEVSVGWLFDAVAAAHAEDVALLSGAQTVSYRSLQRKANQFARLLKRQGVMPGDAVATLTGRSVSTLIAYLGILKVGAAYVPLDPAEPTQRLVALLGDCAATLVLEGGPPGTASVVPGTPTLALGEALAAALHESDEPLNDSVDPSGTACLMYTSGSSGRPKGVVVPHRAVVRLVRQQSYAPFGPDETMLHLAPLTFDASTFEIWGALLNGGRLAIVTADQPSLQDIADAIRCHDVTTAWFTAGLFALLVDHRLDALRPLRCILAGGDVLSPAHVRRAYAGLPECRIVNGYGPTENTTFTCCYLIPRGGWGGGSVPIGMPIRGTEVHILGPDLAPVEPGEVGQICCSGRGLALGYLGQPDLTEAAFIRNPSGGAAEDRLYLTGDLGRRRPDGALEFCGRRDSQVKISGKRVEFGAIEDALRSDPDIRDAVVIAHPTPSGTKQITAYLRPREAWAPRDAAARSAAALSRVAAVLPAYMVPTATVVVSEFPLTVNGKVDRARLAPPAPVRPLHRRAGTPRTDTEDAVAAIWRDVLRVPNVGRDTNFFDLGGTSLLIMAVHERLQRALSPRLSLVALFELTTVRAIAAALDRAGDEGLDRRPRPPGAAAGLETGAAAGGVA